MTTPRRIRRARLLPAALLPLLLLITCPTSSAQTLTTQALEQRTASTTIFTAAGVQVVTPAGVILPNHARTPGATNPAVTQTTIHRTICTAGWTATIRPRPAYTEALKKKQLAHGYAYRGDRKPADYEEDHLISLELGGSPTSPRNLWPQPYRGTGAHAKDRIENKLHQLVCRGTLPLATAQHAIATNWYTAYRHYLTAPAPTPAPAPAPAVDQPTPAPAPATDQPTPPAPAPTPAPAQATPGPPAGATALCNDGSYSYAAHHQGACSHHGGVNTFYN